MEPTEHDHTWYKNRGYLHFDQPIGFKKAKSIVESPSKVAKHAFWPLINYEISSDKLAKTEEGVLRLKPKVRPIAYASHIDSHIYSYYSQLLAQKYEAKLNEYNLSTHVLAFRSLGKSNIEFAHEAFNAISTFGPCGAVCLDISGFFDNLDHSILKTTWQNLLDESSLPADHYAVFKSLTKFSSVNKDELYKALSISKSQPKKNRDRVCSPLEFDEFIRKQKLIKSSKNNYGIPQGSPISALISNIYMLEFDKQMAKIVKDWKGHYFRYCDDMLFIVPIAYTNQVAGIARRHIKNLKLQINTKKTEIRRFTLTSENRLVSDKPLQYLGFLFNGHQTFIRSAAFARFSERMKGGVRLAKRTQYKRNKIRLESGESTKPLYKEKLYERYSHLGQRNFIRYGLRAAEIMESKTIRRQLKPLWRNLQSEMSKRRKQTSD